MKIEKESRSRLFKYFTWSAVTALLFNACMRLYFYLTQGTISSAVLPGMSHPVDHGWDVYALWALSFWLFVLIEIGDGLLTAFFGLLCFFCVIPAVNWGLEPALEVAAASAVFMLARSLWRSRSGASERDFQ